MFVVSGSQDCTIKLWKVGKALTEGDKEIIARLNVKYTQLAHDKVRGSRWWWWWWERNTFFISCPGYQCLGCFSK